jgi:hypothetical protein
LELCRILRIFAKNLKIMAHSKYFTVAEAYSLFPAISGVLKKCQNFDIAIRKVVVDYNKGKDRILKYRFIIGAKGVVPQSWTLFELKEWLSRQKNYTTPPVAQKKKKFTIPVLRIGYACRDIEVEARSEEEARQIALDTAGEFDFSEHSSEYMIDD